MPVIIRRETPSDYRAVDRVVQTAFAKEPLSDQSENLLVQRLRKSPEFVPELSLVATQNDRVVGHILLTEIKIENAKSSSTSLALAPVSVTPKYQGKGIGSQLIKASHDEARKLGYRSIVLIGHEHYYPRFGYKLTSKYGIILPFEAPEVNCMVKELVPGGLQGVKGMVRYSEAFLL